MVGSLIICCRLLSMCILFQWVFYNKFSQHLATFCQISKNKVKNAAGWSGFLDSHHSTCEILFPKNACNKFGWNLMCPTVFSVSWNLKLLRIFSRFFVTVIYHLHYSVIALVIEVRLFNGALINLLLYRRFCSWLPDAIPTGSGPTAHIWRDADLSVQEQGQAKIPWGLAEPKSGKNNRPTIR